MAWNEAKRKKIWGKKYNPAITFGIVMLLFSFVAGLVPFIIGIIFMYLGYRMYKKYGRTIKTETKKTGQKQAVSKWLKAIAILLVIAIVILDYSDNRKQTSNDDIGVSEAIGMTLITVIGGIIFLACGSKTSKWAKEINKNVNLAYAIGVLFSLLGLLGYWIYYKVKK